VNAPAADARLGVRAFVALPLDDGTREQVERALEPLRERLRGVRWSGASPFHVPLRFLGDAPQQALGELREPLARAAAACPAARARLKGLGIFPARGAPRVLWLGVEAPAPVRALQADCERAAVAAGFVPERKPFRPHLTLGRWRGAARRLPLPPLDLGEAALERLVLFASDLHPSGARHRELAAWPLGGVA